jgi:hypothetical protein
MSLNSEPNSQSAIPGVVGGLLAIGVIMATGTALVIILVMVVKRKQGRITSIEKCKGCSILKFETVVYPCILKVALLWMLFSD